MKKSILILIMLVLSAITLSCSNNNDNSNNTSLSTEEQKLIGTWKVFGYGNISSTGVETTTAYTNTCLNTYSFTADKNVNYKNYFNCNLSEENGTWTFVNGLLTCTFPQTSTVVMKNNVTFINDNKIKVFNVGVTNSYEIYVKNTTNPIVDTSYKVEITGTYKNDWCNAVGNTTKVKFEFLQDNNVFATQNEQSNIVQSITVSKDLTGNIIGIRVKLTDYNPADLNAALGDGFENLHLKITGNQTQDVLINTNPSAWLVSCTDICYQIDLLFNTSTKQLTVNSLFH